MKKIETKDSMYKKPSDKNRLAQLIKLARTVPKEDKVYRDKDQSNHAWVVQFIQAYKITGGGMRVKGSEFYDFFCKWAMSEEMIQLPTNTTFGTLVGKMLPKRKSGGIHYYLLNNRLEDFKREEKTDKN